VAAARAAVMQAAAVAAAADHVDQRVDLVERMTWHACKEG